MGAAECAIRRSRTHACESCRVRDEAVADPRVWELQNAR